MASIDSLIQAVVGLFIVALLGYVFFTVLWTLNPVISILFIVAIFAIVIMLIRGIFRGGD
jgi:hypothetical protein